MVEHRLGRDVTLNVQHLVGVPSNVFTLTRRERYCCLWLLLLFFSNRNDKATPEDGFPHKFPVFNA